MSLGTAGQVNGSSSAAEEAAGRGGGGEFTHECPAQKTATRARGNGRQHAEHDTGTQHPALPTQVTQVQWFCAIERDVRTCVMLLYSVSLLYNNAFLFMCHVLIIINAWCTVHFLSYLTYLHVYVCVLLFVCI